MVTGIIGQKIGMTQLFDESGRVQPATVIKAGPCVVVQNKTAARESYDAVQIGLIEARPARANKPIAGHYKKAGVAPTRIRREVSLAPGSESPALGDQVLVSLFANGDQVDVVGVSRGKGFQGVMKRYGFAGGAASHGSMFHRAPGSIGGAGRASMAGSATSAGDRFRPRSTTSVSIRPPCRPLKGGCGVKSTR